jgi:hypothetical protein
MATRSDALVGESQRVRAPRRRISLAETKHASKTTEFYAMIAAIAGILIAAWWIGRDDDAAADLFKAERAWLYVTIVAAAYMVSRGLAKSGSYDRDGDDDLS